MKELEMNPYVVQIDKFVTSLEKLSHAFLHLEKEKNELTDEQYRNMNEDVKERLCKQCEKRRSAKGMNFCGKYWRRQRITAQN